jgi:hypothetical protein
MATAAAKGELFFVEGSPFEHELASSRKKKEATQQLIIK